MDTREIISFLNYPDRGLVDYALSCANLTRHEQEILERRYRQSETVEQAAEYLLISPRTAATWSASAMDKLDNCWSGKSWVNTLIKQ